MGRKEVKKPSGTSEPKAEQPTVMAAAFTAAVIKAKKPDKGENDDGAGVRKRG